MPRPFRAPGYPWVPGFALACAVVCLLTMVYYNPQVALWFGLMMAAGLATRSPGEDAGTETEVVEAMARQGNTIKVSSPDEANRHFRSELAKYAAIVKQIGLEPQ